MRFTIAARATELLKRGTSHQPTQARRLTIPVFFFVFQMEDGSNNNHRQRQPSDGELWGLRGGRGRKGS